MRAWLTPNVESLTNPLECRKIGVSGDLWLYVQGALELLCMENNWEQFGDATPEEMAQHFMNTLDAFSASACGSAMRSIEDTEFIILDVLQTTNIVETIGYGDLPEDALDCSAIYCRVTYYTGTGASIFSSADGDSSSTRARQLRPSSTGTQVHFMTFPINSGQVTFRVNGSGSTDRYLGVNMIGWW